MDRKSRFPIRKFERLEAMKDEEYQYWQGRPARERIAAVSEITTEVEIDAGLKIPCIDADSLIAAKLASGRPEDLADVAALRRAARSLTEPKL